MQNDFPLKRCQQVLNSERISLFINLPVPVIFTAVVDACLELSSSSERVLSC
jgi:hypothetical protein